ncbi:hypothetical protein F5Y03DRAFT_378096 [Xylaria venustula]|nr:hypothetical protein F5Y03DRAFT_378096 [Xylaria venustula]
MSFQFVDQSGIINNSQRKLIRSHVMKGKNTGKKRSKREQQQQEQHIASTAANKSIVLRRGEINNLDESASTTHSQRGSSILAVTRQIANDPSLLSSTKGIAPQTMFHLRQMSSYILDVTSPPEFCQSTGVTEWIWFQLAFYNKAYFHCTVAIASACAAFLTGDTSHSPVALCHMSEAYRLLNKTLSSNEPLSDATIAVVAAINIYDRLYGDPQKAMVHLEGLAGLVVSRGGIAELARRNFVVAEKALRSDIELALSCGSTPKFSSEDVPRHLILIHPRPPKSGEAELAEESILHRAVSAHLSEVVLEILHFSNLLDRASREEKLDSMTYQCTLLYIGYRLLETKPAHSNSEAIKSRTLDSLVLSALTGFQNTFCFGIGRKLMAFPRVIDRFRSVSQNIRADTQSQQMVVLWSLLMGRVSALVQDEDDEWLIPKMKSLADVMGLRAWVDVSGLLVGFPWVRVAHEIQGREFWDAKIARLSRSLESA